MYYLFINITNNKFYNYFIKSIQYQFLIWNKVYLIQILKLHLDVELPFYQLLCYNIIFPRNDEEKK